MNWLKRLLGLHTHTWTTIKSFTSEYGDVRIVQARECIECGYRQIKSEDA